MSRPVGKDLQPEGFEQSHVQDVLVFVTDGDVVKENSFQLETKPAVEIDIAHIMGDSLSECISTASYRMRERRHRNY
jgi:hypothetical protein